jgi:uncharacterized protein (UPF0335 family)
MKETLALVSVGVKRIGMLRSIVERVERLEVEKGEIAEQIKEVFAEAKGNGFDVKILRKVVRIRKQDRAKRLEEEAILDLYLSAIGEIETFTPRTPADETRIAITFAGGRTVSGTKDEVRQALSEVSDDESLYRQALEFVRADGNASTSHVQRRLQIGYNRAASLIERMEREGIVSPPDVTGKRFVIAPPPTTTPTGDHP